MTATDPRPALAAMLAEKLAPAAAALATAYAEDASPEPPPLDDRALAERHRAARAQLDHLHKLLALLDWAGAHLPEPEPAEEPACGPDEARDEPRPYVCDYDGSDDEFRYGGEVWVGSQETPEFKAWLADLERRTGPLPRDSDRLLSSMIGERLFIGDLDSPEYHEWHERRDRRDIEELERWLDGDDPDDDAGSAPRGGTDSAVRTGRTPCPNPAA